MTANSIAADAAPPSKPSEPAAAGNPAMTTFQLLIAQIDIAIRSSARFVDADAALIEQLTKLIQDYNATKPKPVIQLKPWNELK